MVFNSDGRVGRDFNKLLPEMISTIPRGIIIMGIRSQKNTIPASMLQTPAPIRIPPIAVILPGLVSTVSWVAGGLPDCAAISWGSSRNFLLQSSQTIRPLYTKACSSLPIALAQFSQTSFSIYKPFQSSCTSTEQLKYKSRRTFCQTLFLAPVYLYTPREFTGLPPQNGKIYFSNLVIASPFE